MRTSTESLIERNLNRRRSDFRTESRHDSYHRQFTRTGTQKIIRQDSYDPIQHSSFYTEKPAEVTIHEPPKETAKGESIALDQDRENGSNHEIIMSKDEVPTSQVKVDSLRRVDSVHDKMARVLFKTLNYIEEDNHNRAHRKPSMVETEKEAVNTKAKALYEALQKFTPEAKIAKAARHFQDAIYLRAVRNDIDRILKLPYNLIVNNNKFLVWCYKVQTNPKWQDFLYWMSWIFMALIILEPNHSGKDNYYDTRDTEYHFLVGFESTILVLFAGELFMDIFHRTSDNVKTFWYKYIRNFKVLIKTIVFFLFFIDALIFYSSLPNVTFRFSRILRPCCIALYHKHLRRTVVGLIKSVKNMIDILIFFLIIIVLYAFLGCLAIGDLNHEQHYDPLLDNFSDFSVALNNMYLFLSRENYPEIMLPAFRMRYNLFNLTDASPIYALYFIPFLLLDMLLLVPIPIAVMFDSFRGNRAKLYVKDTIKERDALCACFLCLDTNLKNKIDVKQFRLMLRAADYRADDSVFQDIFNILDFERRDSINLEEFLPIVEVLEEHKHWFVKPKRIPKIFTLPRKLFNRIFRFNKLAKSKFLSFGMTFFAAAHIAILISLVAVHNEHVLETLEEVNSAFIWVYVGEAAIKIIGLGFRPYLLKRTNIIDLFITIVTILPDIFMIHGHSRKFLRSLSVFRVLKLMKIIKSFKPAPGKPSNNTVWRIWRLFSTLIVCFPIAVKLAVVLFMLTYAYAIVGMEIYPTSSAVHEHSEYIHDHYYNFDNFPGAILTLFHVINQATWTMLEIDFAYRFNSLGRSAAFFTSYHAFASQILISLIIGLIWEIFDYVTKEEESHARNEQNIVEKVEKVHLDSVEDPLNEDSLRESKSPVLRVRSHNHFVGASGGNIPDGETKGPYDRKRFVTQVVMTKTRSESPLKKDLTKEGTIFVDGNHHIELPPNQTGSLPFKDEEIGELAMKKGAYFDERTSASDDMNRKESITPKISFAIGDCDFVPSMLDSLYDMNEIPSNNQYPSNKEYPSMNNENLRSRPSYKSIVPVNVKEGPSDPISITEREFFKKKIQVYIPDLTETNTTTLQFTPERLRKKFPSSKEDLGPSPKNHSAERSPKFGERSPTSKKPLSPRRKKSLNEDKIIGKALVHGGAKDTIQKYKEDKLKDTTNWFSNIGSFNKLDNYGNVFQMENKILVQLMRVLRDPVKFSEDFSRTLANFENEINTELLGKASFNKFIFGDVKGNWFYFSVGQEGIDLVPLKKGVWDFFSSVFPDLKKFYESKDVFFYNGKSEVIKESIERLYTSFCNISRSFEGCSFRRYFREDYIFDFNATPFEYKDTQRLRRHMIKYCKLNKDVDVSMLLEKMVFRGLHVTLTLVGKADLSNMNGNEFRRGTQDMDTIIQPKVPVTKKETSKPKGTERSQTKRATNIVTEDEMPLPKEELVEFLRDVRDILELNSEAVLEKVTEVYLRKNMDSRKKA